MCKKQVHIRGECKSESKKSKALVGRVNNILILPTRKFMFQNIFHTNIKNFNQI
jgi:hypothetical protein